MSKQKLKLKKKSKSVDKTRQDKQSKQKLSTTQKAALTTVQKQLQLIKLKEALVLIGFTGGAALLRIPMQGVPSAEPLTFFAILAGWLFGRKKGAIVGATSLYISNFFMFGGQGPWSIFQLLGFGAAGFLGGFLRKKASYFEVITIVAISTLIFELVINAFTPLMIGVSFFMTFALAIPFMIVHLVSNIIFAFALPKAKKFVEKAGGFNEKDICVNILNKYNIGTKHNWIKRILGRKFGSR